MTTLNETQYRLRRLSEAECSVLNMLRVLDERIPAEYLLATSMHVTLARIKDHISETHAIGRLFPTGLYDTAETMTTPESTPDTVPGRDALAPFAALLAAYEANGRGKKLRPDHVVYGLNEATVTVGDFRELVRHVEWLRRTLSAAADARTEADNA